MKKNIKTRNISIILFIAIFIAFRASADAKVLMQPYLQGLDSESVFVMVETDSKKPVTVKFGEDKTLPMQANTLFYMPTTENTYVHKIYIQNLNPGSKYYYQAVHGDYQSVTAEFRTMVAPGESFRFGVFGDCRSNPKMNTKLAKALAGEKPLFSLFLGDLCNTSSYDSWKEEFFVKAQLDLAATSPFFNAFGNHEDWEQNAKVFTQSPGPSREDGEYVNKPFYSFDCGDAHFLVLNTEVGVGERSEQFKFAKKDLESTDKKWKFVAFHIPAYCAGGHGENKNMKRMTTKIFEPAGVDVVFNGHSHFYQRNFVNGVYHVIAAGGGAPLYSPKSKSYVQKSAKKHHYGYVDVSPGKLSVRFIDDDGKVVDEFEIAK